VVLGIAGGLLHVWNHGLFKGLLFLAAGSVIHATRTREIDRLGGLLKPMPRTGLAFLVGATAISGLPPLNGFISELLIYVGLFRATTAGSGRLWIAAALSAAGLALIGALAVACFVKVFSAVFLGVPRSEATARAHEANWKMTAPMGVLALLCAFARGRDCTPLAPVLWTGLRTKIGTRRQRRRAFLELVMPPGILRTADRDALAERLAPLFGHDLAVEPPVTMSQLGAMRAYDGTPRLSQLDGLPTLVVSAAHDRIASPAAGRALASGIRGARYVELPHAAHGATIQCAADVNALLIEHLGRG